MEKDFLTGILLRDEDERTEFKLAYHVETDKLKNEVAKDLVSLANATGRNSEDYAYLVIGAGNGRDVNGKRPAQDVRGSKYSARNFLDIVNSRCTPPLRLRYEVVEIDGMAYGVITILPSPEIHYLVRDLDTPKGFWRKHSVLTRVGDQVELALPQELLKMEREKQQWGRAALINDDVDLRDIEATKKGVQRRAFMWWLTGGLTGLLAKVADTEGMLQFSKRLSSYVEYDPEADQACLERLFGIGSAPSGAVFPAANHPFKLPVGECYPTERDNCTAYRERFLKNISLRVVRGFPNAKPDDSLILFGSQVSNLNSRLLLGNPFNLDRPKLCVAKPADGWQARLRWNLYTPVGAPIISRQQFGAPWVTRNHFIGGSKGETYESKRQDEVLEDDYLLITALPRFARGTQRIIVFAGCHGPGQKAATLLLRKSPSKQLQVLANKIAGEPYYQALFHVDLARDDEGEFFPKQAELIDAFPLDIEFSRT